VKVWWLLVYGASIVAAFAPWIPLAAHQTSRIVTGGFWIPPVTPYTLCVYVLHAFVHALDIDATGWYVFPSLAFFVALGVALRSAMNERGGHALLWCLLGIPWLCLFLLSCPPLIPIFHPRYVLFSLPALLALIAIGVLALRGRLRVLVLAALLLTQLVGLRLFWKRGNYEKPGYLSMKRVAKEISKPVDGEIPTVVATWQFGFFDARATLPMSQQVAILRDSVPEEWSTDAIYFDKPGWWILKLEDVPTRHVWILDSNESAPVPLPAGWKILVNHRRGYVRERLVEVVRPAAGPKTVPSGSARPE